MVIAGLVQGELSDVCGVRLGRASVKLVHASS
jgi:hypothetical protein